ncbi:Formamidopyrimidine-DNA glycosylase N-terminal domain-containing protein [Bisporella sp. PMI_857]|nr:Formamidopyrimidine-DNA glycosylase N-terminal domain-containing protein [Bisporella sp. PMI_857]
MPEIAEVARIVHYLRKFLVGKTLKVVNAQDDASVFGKVGGTGAEFQKALTGKKVIGAGQQGKYFWLTMESAPHPVMHLGMTGWVHIRGQPSVHYRPKETDEAEEWPPKYWKFTLETDGEPKVEAAFTDARRFGRIRLVNCPAEDIRNTSPLKENGPDPVIDRDVITEKWLENKVKSKKVPIKALLLDQANISGIGNWVGDEILYHAKLHPEQYSDSFSSAQLKQLRASILHITKTAVDLLGDSSKFPDEWIFNHRWGKGKKDAPRKLPNGATITFLTVGGRTSCVVPSVQKKTGAVAGDINKANKEAVEAIDNVTESKPKTKKRKTKSGTTDEEEDSKLEAEAVEEEANPKKQKTESAPRKAVKTPKAKGQISASATTTVVRRRSGRFSKG